MRTPIIIIIALFSVSLSLAQSSELTISNSETLLYFAEGQNNFLVPMIEDILKDLRFTGREQRMFTKVTSLNLLLAGKDIRMNLDIAFDYYDRGKSEGKGKTESRQIETRVDDKTAATLKQHNLLLYVHINQLNSIFEYQITLLKFSVRADDKASYSFVTPEFGVYRSTSILIDPLKPNYKQELRSGLIALFKEANEKPKPMLISKSHPMEDNKIITTVNDTVRLEANVLDDDSPKEKIRHAWDFSPYKNFSLVGNQETAKDMIFHKAGTYTVELQVSDGISEFSSTSCTVIVQNRPVINRLNYTYYRRTGSHSYWHPKVYFASNQADVFTYTNADYHYRKAGLQFSVDIEEGNEQIKYSVRDVSSTYAKEEFIDTTQCTKTTTTKVIGNLKNRSKFNVLEYREGNRVTFRVVPPNYVPVPSQYEMKITSVQNGIESKPKFLLLNFRQKKRLFINCGYGFLFTDGLPDLAIQAGLGYTLFSGQTRINVQQGVYIFKPRFEKYPPRRLNNFQDMYLQVPIFRLLPAAVKLGFRNNIIESFQEDDDEYINDHFLLTGLEYIIDRKVFDGRLSFIWTENFNIGYCTRQFAFDVIMNFHFEKRMKTKG